MRATKELLRLDQALQMTSSASDVRIKVREVASAPAERTRLMLDKESSSSITMIFDSLSLLYSR